MSSKNNIAIISNLTSGGGVVYKKNLLNNMSYSKFYEYSPRKFDFTKSRPLKTLIYLKYVYFDLIYDYYKIAQNINKNKDIQKVIVFQDSYIKAPYALFFLKIKSLYVLHEPPREFYEPMWLHSVSKLNYIFNYLFRYPIKHFDYILTRMATVVIVNSRYSNKVIQKIYKRNSKIVYPGVNSPKKHLKNNKVKIGCISVGSLMDYKGHKKTIELISRIHISKRPPLIIIGGGNKNQVKSLVNLGNKLNVKLTIEGGLTDKEVVDRYERAKIFINNAYLEPFGLAALESIVYGCMLVTNNGGGTKEIKKYFPEKVTVCADDLSMVNAVEDALSQKNNLNVKIPSIFNWQKIALQIYNL